VRALLGGNRAKQRIVAMSSCEVEYIAAASASCQMAQLAQLLSEILDNEVGRLVLKFDNKYAISLITCSMRRADTLIKVSLDHRL
jgi:hypothetical protein